MAKIPEVKIETDPQPIVDPPAEVPKPVQKIADQAEEGTIDITEAIIKAYNLGVKHGSETKKETKTELTRSEKRSSFSALWHGPEA